MKHKDLILGSFAIIILAISFYFSWQGYTQIVAADTYAKELFALQAAQSKTEQDVKALLARQLGAQAHKINVYDNSGQMTAVLLAVQSMKLLPTIDAAQVLQYNLSARETSRMEQDSAVLSAAFNPDGKFTVTGSSDHLVRVWETFTGKEVLQMRHDDVVQAVVFSPDGKHIASASADHTIRIWDAASGKEVARMTQMGTKLSIAYSPNGKYIVSSGSDRTVRVWDTATGAEVAHFLHDNSVTSIAFSPDSRHVATGSADNTARVWNVTTGKEIARAAHKKPVTAVAFSPNGKIVISGSMDNTAQTWDAATGEGVALILDQGKGAKDPVIRSNAPVNSVAFSPDGKYIAIGGEEPTSAWMSSEIGGSLHIIFISPDESKNFNMGWYRQLDKNVDAVVFSPDSRYLLTSSEDHTARVWDIFSGEVSRMTHDDTVTSIAFSPDGKHVLSSSLDGTARVWEALSWQKITQGNHETPVTSIAFSPDSKHIASSDESGTILIRETTTGLEVARTQLDAPVAESGDGIPFYYTPKTNRVNSIAFSPDGKYLVSGNFDNTIRIWDAGTLREVRRITSDYEMVYPFADGKPYYSRGINSVAFSPDGNYVASGGAGGMIYIWKVNNGWEFARMVIEKPVNPTNYNSNSTVLSVNFSPNGRYVVSGSWDNTVRIWDIANEREVVRMTQNDKIARHGPGGDIYVSPKVNSVAFSPDGKYVVSGSEDNTVRLWDVSTGNEILNIEHDYFIYSITTGRYTKRGWGPLTGGKVTSVAFSSDGKYIMSVSDDGTVGIWDVSTGQGISRIVHYLNVFRDHVISAVISPDGKYVASGDSRGQINLWLWRPDDLIADACSRLPRNLTREEWTKYIGDVLPYQAVCPNLPIE